MTTIGLLGAGEMGSALAREFRAANIRVCAVAEGRGSETIQRMKEVGIEDAGDLAGLLNTCDIVISVLPPEHAEVEASLCAEKLRETGRELVFVEANAISPERARRIAQQFVETNTTYVDGGLVGAPPYGSKRPRLYLSGPRVKLLQALDGNGFDLVHLGADIGHASGLKMVYAAMTKGTNSLLTAGYIAAERLGLAAAFRAEMASSQTELHSRAEKNIARLPADAGRWVFEMLEIAATLETLDLPTGFHTGAAEIMQMLAQSEFGTETRRNRDTERSAADTITRIASTRKPFS